jgi:hypothetical protein
VQVDQRLVVETQSVVIKRLAQHGLRAEAADAVVAQPVLEELDLVAAGILGPVHGDVGVPQQRSRADRGARFRRREGDAHAGRDDDVLPGADRDRHGDGGPQPGGERKGLVDARHLLGQDDELVAAEPGHRVGRTHDPFEATGDLHEQVVPGGVAEGVVDELEAVEVQEQHRHRPRPALRPGQRLAQLVHEQAAVRQPRQRVVQGAVERPPERRFRRECQGATAAVTAGV